MLTGADAVTRSSTAVSRKVWVPPPEAPVQPMRLPSTSGRLCRKSTARMLFQSWMPRAPIPHRSSREPPKARWAIWQLSTYPAMSQEKLTNPRLANSMQRPGTEQASPFSRRPPDQCPCGWAIPGKRFPPGRSGR